MYYVTGDTHRNFKLVAAFCDKVQSTTDDTLIILGDAGINYFCFSLIVFNHGCNTDHNGV